MPVQRPGIALEDGIAADGRRIALVGPCAPYRGGIAHHTAQLYHTLQRTHAVTVFNFSRLYPTLLFPGKTQIDQSRTAIEAPSQRMLDSCGPLSWAATARALSRFEPDLVLFQWWHPFFAPAYRTIAGRLRGKARIAYLCHNALPHEGSILWKRAAQIGLRAADAFIVHSEQDRQDVAGLIPDALVLKAFLPTYDMFPTPSEDKAACRSLLGVTADKVLLFFGLIRHYKGLNCLLDALARIRRREDVHLIVAGEFYDDRAPYEAQIARLGLQEAVHLFDRYIPNEEVGRFFVAADAVVLPYLSATQSAVLQTAYGFDKPVITTDVGGLGEAVCNGETGYLVPAGNEAELARAVLKFYEAGGEPAFAPQVRLWKRQFRWERLAEIVESILP